MSFLSCMCEQALVASGCSVLVSSYTNSAVDNILGQLKGSDVDFIRLGSESAVRSDIQEHRLGGMGKYGDTSTAALKRIKDEIKVVSLMLRLQ